MKTLSLDKVDSKVEDYIIGSNYYYMSYIVIMLSAYRLRIYSTYIFMIPSRGCGDRNSAFYYRFKRLTKCP